MAIGRKCLEVLLVPAFVFVPFPAHGETERGAIGPSGMTPETIANKVNAADYVFLGETKRIYFVDEYFREIPDDEAAANSHDPTRRIKPAVAEVEVIEAAYPQKGTDGKTVLILTASIPGEEVGRLRSGSVSKRAVFFTKEELFKRVFRPDGSGFNLDKPVRRHVYVKSQGLSGLIMNPIAAEHWAETQELAKARVQRELQRKLAQPQEGRSK